MGIAAVLALVGGVIFFLYRVFWTVQTGRDVIQEGKELAHDTKAFARRTAWNRKRNFNPIDELQDPREVATVLMVETAKYGGEMTATEKAKILAKMSDHFALSSHDAEHMMANVSYLTRSVPDIENVLVKLMRPLHEKLSEREKVELVAMLRDIASTDGAANDYQTRFINIINGKLLGASGTYGSQR